MKIKNIIALFMVLPLLSMAQQTKFQINGSVKNSGLDKIYLIYKEGVKKITDSTRIKDGKFQFQGTISEPIKVSIANFKDKPTREQINQGTAAFVQFYLGEGNTTILVDGKLETAKIEGTEVIKDHNRYKAYIAPAEKGLGELEKLYQSNRNGKTYQEIHKEAKPQRDSLNKLKSKLQIEYATKYPGSIFSAQALYDQTLFNVDLPVIEPLYLKLSDKVRKSSTGLELAQKIKNAKEIAIGQLAPEFQQPDANGKMVKLSDFRGKYVLLDFWASWCVPCRAENPNVKAVYAAYKDKGFAVLNVSLDSDKNKWLKAVAADGLTWTQISSLNGWDNEAVKLYHIVGVPTNFLIDPSGKIIASNLRGEALHKKLKELYNE